MISKGTNKEEVHSGINLKAQNNSISEIAGEDLHKSLKEISDYKYALNESSIVAITDQKGIINHVNENFCKISKYSREELLGQDHRIINSGYHSEAFIRELWVTIANGKIWRGELKNRAKDGTYYWVDTTIVPFLDGQKKPYQYIAIRADITRRKKLEEEQVLFASIVNYSEDAIITKTLGGVITSWNQGAEKIFGYSAAEIIGQHITTLIPAHLWSEEYEIIENIRTGKAIEHYETRRVRKDGRLIHVSLTISPLKNSNGNITGASKIVRDITKQKKAEQQLSNSLQEITDYKSALDESSIVAITDQRGIIQHANENFCNISKYSREELLGQDHRIINSGYHSAAFIKELWVTIANGKIWRGELKNRAKDGTFYWVDTTIVPFLDKAKKPYQYIAIRADITSRKKLEEEQVFIASIVNYSDDAIISNTLDGVLTSWNHGAEKIFGYTTTEIIGKHINTLIPPHLWSEENEVIESIRKGKAIKDYEAHRIRKDGALIYVSLTISPLKDSAGNITGASRIVRDITKQKKAEQELSNSLQEITDYKFALDESSIVAITDQKGIIQHANDNFCNISKYSREELLGQDHRIINSGYHSKEFIKNLWETIANGKIWKGELKNKAKDGTIYWVDTTIIPFLNEKEKPYQYVAIRADITERKLAEVNLKQSLKETADYKYALDESSIIAITNRKGIILHANDNFCKISKYSREELIGQDHRIINSGYHSKEFIKNLWETIAHGKIWKGEIKNKAKDGSVYWVDTTIVPFLNENGKPYQYVAIRADITERKLVEENLELSLKETADYKYALDESSIIAITDQSGIIQYANDNFCKISRYSREELIGQDHRIINSGYHPREFIKNLWTTIANGKIWKGELKNKAKDGTIYWVDTTIVPFLNEYGKPYQYVAIRADITERKKAEKKLIESEKQYRLLFENNPMPMWVIELTTFKFLDVNKMALLQYGYSRKEFLSMTAMDIRPEEDIAHFKQQEHSNNAKETNYNKGIWRHRKKDGSIIEVEIIAHEILFEGARARLILAHDVTEQKQAEQQVQKLNEELEQKVIVRTGQLRKTNEELEAFSYSVSHDLRAPLRAIIGFSTILQEDYTNTLDDEAKRITDVIISNTKKMGQLIDDLLTFSRMGRQEILKSEINTTEMVDQLISEMDKKKNAVKKINWVIHSLPPTLGDINIIKQVWINLISNAVKYSAKAPIQNIEIGSYKQDGQIVFFVKDNGVGFDEKYKNKLFGVFQRLHRTEEFYGTGIGLAIVEKVISKHGGKVWAEGEVDKGACFYFSLPA